MIGGLIGRRSALLVVLVVAAAALSAAAKLSSTGDVRALPVDLVIADPDADAATAAAIGVDPERLDIPINNAAGYVDWSEMASSADLELVE